MSNPDVLTALRANAELAIESLGPISSMAAFGYDRASLAWTDGYLSRQYEAGADGDVRDGLVNVIGSYVGECIIRTYGGRWQEEQGNWAVAFDEQNAVFPFGKVAKHLEYGAEESVLSLFDTIPVIFGVRGPSNDQPAVGWQQEREQKRPWWRFWGA